MQNTVMYEIPRTPAEISAHRRKFWALAGLLVALASVALLVGAPRGETITIAALASVFLFGVNSVAYETPVTGATAPTAAQSRGHNVVSATITGDGAGTTFTITHNWGLTTAQLASGAFPMVEAEYLLAAGYTSAWLITSKTANAVAFSCTAFTGAGLRIRLTRPNPAEVVITPQP